MDVVWVACGYAIALGMLFVGCRIAMRTMPGPRGLGGLQWAIAMAALASLVRGGRLWMPLPVTTFGTNYFFLFYLLLVHRISAGLLRRGSAFLSSILAVWIVGIPLFWCYRDPLHSIAVGSGLKAITAAMTALLCFGRSSPGLRHRARVLGGLHASFAALNLSRIFMTILHPPGKWGPLNLVQTAFSYAQLIFCFVTCCGIVWLAVCEHNQELQQKAETDSLTGLLNRRAFEAVFRQEMQRCLELGSSLALLLVDLDHFKEINDTFGHLAGDQAIMRVSRVLQEGIRSADTLARFGGEEFVILLRDATREQAETLAERLRREIEGLPALQDTSGITASLGLAISRDLETAGDLFDRCDQALYQSKRAGRNVVTVCGLTPSSRSLTV